MIEIGAETLGICRICKRELYRTTKNCRTRAWGGGYPIPRLPSDPPCPVEDGTLAALKRTQPTEEAVARAIWDSPLLQPARGEWRGDRSATEQCCYSAARAVLAIISAARSEIDG